MTKPITPEFIDELKKKYGADDPKKQERPKPPNGNGMPRPALRLEVKTAKDLRAKKFAPLKYIVPDLIVEGLVLLAGKPKVRKSWMALDIGLAVSAGRLCLGDRKPQQGSVLYLGLEDGERRMQRRIDKLLSPFDGEWPEAFNYETKWPRADQGGIDAIDSWCEEHPDARLVVIDVLARFRAPANSRASAYAEDYAALAKLQELAVKRAITILVIHHTRKGESEDPVEEISGTLGLAGCADAFLVLKRTSAGATLTGRGRDSEDVDLAVQFSDATCKWTILGAASEVHRSDQRSRVMDALSWQAEGMSPADLSAELGISSASARQMLVRMARAGEIRKGKYGRYFHLNVPVTPVTPPVTPVTLQETSEKESKDKGLAAKRVTVTGVTGGSRPVTPKSKLSASAQGAVERAITRRQTQSTTPDYLGPPGDDPADFLN